MRMNSFLERKSELKFSKDFTEKDFEKDIAAFHKLAMFLFGEEEKDLEDYYFYLKKSGKTEKQQVELIKAWMITKLDKNRLKLVFKRSIKKMGLRKTFKLIGEGKKWLGQ